MNSPDGFRPDSFRDTDFRHIGLRNVIYKVIAKYFVNGLRPILDALAACGTERGCSTQD